jgi:hypothetical protein
VGREGWGGAIEALTRVGQQRGRAKPGGPGLQGLEGAGNQTQEHPKKPPLTKLSMPIATTASCGVHGQLTGGRGASSFPPDCCCCSCCCCSCCCSAPPLTDAAVPLPAGGVGGAIGSPSSSHTGTGSWGVSGVQGGAGELANGKERRAGRGLSEAERAAALVCAEAHPPESRGTHRLLAAREVGAQEAPLERARLVARRDRGGRLLARRPHHGRRPRRVGPGGGGERRGGEVGRCCCRAHR